jgi:hypothetical protein
MAWTSFNIGAGGATELSSCDWSGDPEMGWAEGERENERRVVYQTLSEVRFALDRTS